MKRLLLILALLLMVVGVQGLALDFQNPSDFTAQVGVKQGVCMSGVVTWTQNTSGGNSYLTLTAGSNDYGDSTITAIISQTALPMTYSAATLKSIQFAGLDVQLLDGAGNIMYTWEKPTVGTVGARYELIMQGLSPNIYIDGVIQNAGATPLTQNPSYVGWGMRPGAGNWCGQGGLTYSVAWDDIIWGSTESKYIFGMPETGYFLQKDILNPAASGFYRVNQTDPNGTPTLIYSYSMPSTFGKGNGNNETVYLNNYGGGNYQTYYTGTMYAGNIAWNLTDFFASTAPYGLYVTTIPGSVTYSDIIPYIGSGASINFDKNSYAIGETAIATVIVSDSYYDLATYSYHVVIQDIYGIKVYDEPISFSIPPHTGTASYTWLDTDGEGLYYGLIYAKRLSDNEEILMNLDTAELSSTLVVNGYVFDATTAGTIPNTTVTITQGVTTNGVVSGFDGNYTSTSNAFVANSPTTLVANKTGYETYQHVFTPLMAGSISINLTLMPTTPTFSGVALGGIARTPPYNRTIDSATITITNANATYTVTTNSAGYYIKNYMRPNEWWNVIGSKTGFGNSSTYNKLVVGI